MRFAAPIIFIPENRLLVNFCRRHCKKKKTLVTARTWPDIKECVHRLFTEYSYEFMSFISMGKAFWGFRIAPGMCSRGTVGTIVIIIPPYSERMRFSNKNLYRSRHCMDLQCIEQFSRVLFPGRQNKVFFSRLPYPPYHC